MYFTVYSRIINQPFSAYIAILLRPGLSDLMFKKEIRLSFCVMKY
jgi:hypothetical protein